MRTCERKGQTRVVKQWNLLQVRFIEVPQIVAREESGIVVWRVFTKGIRIKAFKLRRLIIQNGIINTSKAGVKHTSKLFIYAFVDVHVYVCLCVAMCIRVGRFVLCLMDFHCIKSLLRPCRFANKAMNW